MNVALIFLCRHNQFVSNELMQLQHINILKPKDGDGNGHILDYNKLIRTLKDASSHETQ